jgi:photosystem II stability/assembly factor-like uncharacterized protein
MDDDDIRQALHATYTATGTAPTFSPDVFKAHVTRPRRRPLVTSLVAAVAAVVVAVPISIGVFLRSGVNGGSSGSGLSVLDLHMYSMDDGWAWSGGDNILHTTSGVGHWTVVPPPIGTELIAGLAFAGADSARVLAAPADSYNELERSYTLTPWTTDDAGATWTEGQPFSVLLEAGADPTNDPVYPDLDFVDATHGWFFDSQGIGIGAPMFIYRTVDGGLHWSQVEMTPATGAPARGALPVGCAMYGMTFVSSTTGWVAGSCGQATLFDVTHDGGVTWAPQEFPCIKCALYPPKFSSPLDGSVFGGSGSNGLFVTTDGGRTWDAGDEEPPGNWPDFVDSQHGFVMGETGNANPLFILWTTADGGMHWGEAPGGAIHGNGPRPTSTLDFVTPEVGWAVSFFVGTSPALSLGQTPYAVPAPELWQTTNAGSSWTLITPTFSTSK